MGVVGVEMRGEMRCEKAVGDGGGESGSLSPSVRAKN